MVWGPCRGFWTCHCSLLHKIIDFKGVLTQLLLLWSNVISCPRGPPCRSSRRPWLSAAALDLGGTATCRHTRGYASDAEPPDHTQTVCMLAKGRSRPSHLLFPMNKYLTGLVDSLHQVLTAALRHIQVQNANLTMYESI